MVKGRSSVERGVRAAQEAAAVAQAEAEREEEAQQQQQATDERDVK